MVAIGEDALQMPIHHPDKTSIRFKPCPFQRILPELPELPGACLGFIGPHVAEAFFEQMSLAQARRSA